jgi:N-acetylglucosamine-6-phosphate deacetylase
MKPTVFTGARIFDGTAFRDGSLVIEDGRIREILPPGSPLKGLTEQPLGGGILAPGFVDLQVNGGGGVMFNDAPTPETLRTIADAHAGLGATTILPTLITDTPDITRAAIAAAIATTRADTPGIAGLHLEGPHLSVARKGAHDPRLIRPMTDDDLNALTDAARQLPRLMVTLAPESVRPGQVSALAQAGILVSLGHSDADFDTARAYADAGATCVTHLFNAMSQLANREPGLVGAALADGRLHAGLIADGLHVHPATIAAALAAKAGPGGIFLVSDAMAPAGSALTEFTLNGRRIIRSNGRLLLDDGTLAGADLDLPRALRVLTSAVRVSVDQAVAMATSRPGHVLGQAGRIVPGAPADLVHLDDGLHVRAVWRGAVAIPLSAGLDHHP